MTYYLNTPASDFRLKRKCFSICGSLFLMCFLLAAQVACRPADEMYDGLEGLEAVSSDVGEYADVDNVEFHHVKIVDGVMQEDHHPVIMYKEDFVSEDYDANKNQTTNIKSTEMNSSNAATPTRSTRKYKDIAHRRRLRNRHNETQKFRALKPEKIYFDILSQAPVVVADDANNNDSKFDPTKIRVEMISLVDDSSKNNDEHVAAAADSQEQKPSKQLLSKNPKKYHRRMRRDTESHTINKRNPFLHYYPSGINVNGAYAGSGCTHGYSFPGFQQIITHVIHAVPGKKWNGLNGIVNTANSGTNGATTERMPDSVIDRFGPEDEEDVVVWGSRGTTTRGPPTTRRTPPPLFHNSNPEGADFSIFSTSRPQTTRRTPPPLFHDSNPSNVDFSIFSTTRPATTRRPRPIVQDRQPQQPAAAAPSPTRFPARRPADTENEVTPTISRCVWGIVNCCSSQNVNIRYQCFERIGCTGAFWDLNPCADRVKDSVINSLGDIYE